MPPAVSTAVKIVPLALAIIKPARATRRAASPASSSVYARKVYRPAWRFRLDAVVGRGSRGDPGLAAIAFRGKGDVTGRAVGIAAFV
jgi:hypothetical protein